MGWKPSTSLAGSTASRIFLASTCAGSGNCTRMPSISSRRFKSAISASTEELLALIADLNRRGEIDGILVRLPLPGRVDAERILLAGAPPPHLDAVLPTNACY